MTPVNEPRNRLAVRTLVSSVLLVLAAGMISFVSAATAETHEWFISESLGGDGVVWGTNARFYHARAQAAWRNVGGDWTDAKGTAQGGAAYATIASADDHTVQEKSADVTQLIREYASRAPPEVMLHPLSGGVRIVTSRFDPAHGGPRIEVAYADGSGETLLCTANLGLDTSTGMPAKGEKPPYQLRLTPYNVALRFAPPNPAKTVKEATLKLQIQAQQTQGLSNIQVMKVRAPLSTPPVEAGIASKVVEDADLGAQPGVLYFADYASGNYADYFHQTTQDTRTAATSTTPGRTRASCRSTDTVSSCRRLTISSGWANTGSSRSSSTERIKNSAISRWRPKAPTRSASTLQPIQTSSPTTPICSRRRIPETRAIRSSTA